MSARSILPIQQRRVRCHTIIPHHHRPGRPLDAGLEILTFGNVIVEEVEQVVALFFLEADDAPAELGVHVEGFLACRWMRAYQRMDGGDWVAPDGAASELACFGLFDG